MVDLAVVAEIRSNSALALYKIVSRYKSSPGGLTMRMPWRAWITPLTGEPEEALSARGKPRYEEFRYFNRDVIQRAVKELNAVQSEFLVEPVAITKGREVLELQFKITLSTAHVRPRSAKLPVEDNDPAAAAAIERAVEVGASPLYAATLQRDYGTSQLAQQAEIALTTPGIANRAGFLVSSLRSVRAKTSAQLSTSQPASPLQVIQAQSPEQIVIARRNEASAQAKVIWPTLPIEVRDDYLGRFGESEACSTTFVRKAFLESGIKKPFVAAAFFPWLAKTMAEDQAVNS
jgi:hypothetical protein